MSFTAYATAVAGSILTAAFWNQQVYDNGSEIRAGGIALAGQSAGDWFYALDATHIGRFSSGNQWGTICGGNPPGYLQVMGLQTLWLPAGAFYPCKVSGCGPFEEIGTQTNCQGIYGLPFDPNTSELAGCSLVLPKSWDGGQLTCKLYWSLKGASAGAVAWYVNVVQCYADGENLNTYGSFGQGTFTDSALGAKYLHIAGPFSLNVNTPRLYGLTRFVVQRYAETASDTLPEDAYFLGLKVLYNAIRFTDD